MKGAKKKIPKWKPKEDRMYVYVLKSIAIDGMEWECERQEIVKKGGQGDKNNANLLRKGNDSLHPFVFIRMKNSISHAI